MSEPTDQQSLYNSKDQPVHKAAAESTEELQRLLNDDPSLRDQKGWFWRMPLHTAAAAGNAKSVDTLLRLGADPNAAEGLHRDTPLIDAVTADSEACIQLLLNAGADPNQPGRRQQTPIFMARSRFAIQMLIKAGADPDVKDEHGDDPLQNCASYIGSMDVIQFWLERGLDPNREPFVGWPPLHGIVGGSLAERVASETQRVEMLKLLLDHGAAIDLRDKTGVTALYYACQVNLHLTGCVQFLLEQGADPNICDHWGNTPLTFAVRRGYTDIAQLLIKYGADANLPNHHFLYPLDICAELDSKEKRKELEQLLTPLTQKMDRPLAKPTEILSRLHAIPKYGDQRRKRCTKAEIDQLEVSLQLKLPQAYRKFLIELGHGLDDFMISDHWRFRIDEVADLHRDTEYKNFCDLPEHYFVFAERNGYFWAFFVLDGNEDPPVFGFDDGEQRSYRFVNRSVWEFVESLVIDYEHWYGDKTG